MKNSIAVFILSLLVCAGSAFAWPWGNVGLNVSEPEAQLDVGGDVLVRSNLVVRNGTIQIGDGESLYGDTSREKILIWNGPEGRFMQFGNLAETSFAFGYADGIPYGWSLHGAFGADLESPWYPITYGSGVVFGNSVEGTNRASIKVSVDPPGFIFNVNGVIWTNTP